MNRFTQKITSLEKQLQDKMRDELRVLSDEMETRTTLKRKLTEICINDDDLPVSKRVSALMDKYQQEKQVFKFLGVEFMQKTNRSFFSDE